MPDVSRKHRTGSAITEETPMVDNLTPDQRQRAMRAVRSQDTTPEIQLRRALHALGLRFRLHKRDLPGRPDIVLPRWHAVIFVHGCFWHGHAGCARARMPLTRPEYWARKRIRNQARDALNCGLLRAKSWKVKVVWECKLKDPTKVALSIKRWLERG